MATWVDLGYAGEKVVCFDRHLDLKPLSAQARSSLDECGNDWAAIATANRRLPVRDVPGAYGLDDFYAAGGHLGLVGELRWVTPRERFAMRPLRRRLLEHVSSVATAPGIEFRTWFDDAGGLRTDACGIPLVVESLESLSRRRLSRDWRVDVDLDWFADVVSGQDHEPQDLLDLLVTLDLVDNVDSFTYSIRSGFLPADQRHLGAATAQALGRKLVAPLPTGVDPLPAAVFERLRSGSDADTGCEVAAELESLGTVGVVLRGMLDCRAGDLGAAETGWQEAAEAGSTSTWLAYELGRQFYQAQDFTAAARWFDRGRGPLLDTLELSADLMWVLCRVRLGDREAAQAVIAHSDRRPLHLGAAQLALDAARSTDPAQVEHLSFRVARLETIIDPNARRAR